MRIQLSVIGRLRKGPEHELLRDYLSRFKRTGRALGFSDISVVEIEQRKKGSQSTELEQLIHSIPQNAFVVALDERGFLMSSPEFSLKLRQWCDDGVSNLCFLIGGADGLNNDIKSRADFTLSFGKMVWPHMLVRVMLAEQLYRAVCILAGHPYHRA